MTSKQFSAIARKVSHLLPDYVVKGALLFKTTPDAVLVGLNFDGSSRDPKLFRGNALFLPMFVPTEMVHSNYSKRISPKIGQWDADDPNLIDCLTKTVRSDAIPFLNAVSTLPGMADFMRTMVVPNVQGYVNPHCQEALAYTLVKLKDVGGAMAMLHQIQKNLSKPTAPWELALKARVQVIEEKLLPNPEAALTQLETWKVETICKLGLENYCSQRTSS